MSAKSKVRDESGELKKIRFTGAAGGTRYVVGREIVLEKGDTVVVPLVGHWAALVEGGDAEVLE